MGLEKNILSTKTQEKIVKKSGLLWNGCRMLHSIGLFEVVELNEAYVDTNLVYLWEKKYYEKEIKASQ